MWILSGFVNMYFIGGGNQSARRKPLTCRKSLTNFITQCCTSRPDRYFKSHHVDANIVNIFSNFYLKKKLSSLNC